VVAVIVSAIAGLTFALITQRLQFSGKKWLDGVLAIPLVAPGMVLGISLLVVFNLGAIPTGFLTLVFGHSAFITPLVMFVLQQRLKTMDPSIEHASMDLGAGRIKTFWHVTLPGVRVSLLAACLLGFVLSMDEIAVSFFLAGTQPTLPVYVWGLLRFGFTPEVNAVFTLIGAFSLVLIGGAAVMLLATARRREKQLVGLNAT
jgi:ABC-type spermidine/putrescine transport system permease subunit II